MCARSGLKNYGMSRDSMCTFCPTGVSMQVNVDTIASLQASDDDDESETSECMSLTSACWAICFSRQPINLRCCHTPPTLTLHTLFFCVRPTVSRFHRSEMSAIGWSGTLRRRLGGWPWLIRTSADSPMSWMLQRTTTWTQVVWCKHEQAYVKHY